jgi:hypothetical protein
MPDWTDDYYALSGQKPPPGLFEALWCLAKAIIGVIHVSKKKDEPDELTPEDIGQCPTTPEEEQLLDSALNHEQSGSSKRQKKKAENKKEPETTKLSPIDDLIGAVHQPLHRPMVDIPAELRAPKKIWTPEEKKPHIALPQPETTAVGLNNVPLSMQVPADLPGLLHKPFNQYDKQPFIFDNTAWKHDLEDGKMAKHCWYEKLYVFASAVQKSQALIGVKELEEDSLYLWFDCFDGHAVNSTKKPVRMYLIKDYFEFISRVVTPHSVLVIPQKNTHLLMTAEDAPQIEDFEFLNQHMPIKDSD